MQVARVRKETTSDSEKEDAGPQTATPASASKSRSTGNVIVVPIEISKEMIEAKQSGKATTKSEADKDKGKSTKTSDVKKEVATPASSKAKKTVVKIEPKDPKSLDGSPTNQPTRRSKRESNISVKLVEWGLLPASGEIAHLALSLI